MFDNVVNNRLCFDGCCGAYGAQSLLLEEKVPQSVDWGGCGVPYTVAIISALRRKRTAVTPHQSRFARQLLLKEKPWVRISLWRIQRT